MSYYDLNALLRKKDINGKEPTKYIITNNRSAGKTTVVLMHFVDEWMTDNNRQFCLIYRTAYEKKAAHMILEEPCRFCGIEDVEVGIKNIVDTIIYQIFINEKPAGYSISLAQADKLKKYSSIFAKVENALFDEYQLERGKYLKHEVADLTSVLMTVSRGGGKQSRPIKFFMCGNDISVLNPHLIELGIPSRLRPDTNFLRGDGWIADFRINESAKEAIESNDLFKGLSADYVKGMTAGKFLKNFDKFICKPKGNSRYFLTIVFRGKYYGVRYFEDNFIYVTTKYDASFKRVVTNQIDDFGDDMEFIDRVHPSFKLLMEFFNRGVLRFDSHETEEAMFSFLGITLYD